MISIVRNLETALDHFSRFLCTNFSQLCSTAVFSARVFRGPSVNAIVKKFFNKKSQFNSAVATILNKSSILTGSWYPK